MIHLIAAVGKSGQIGLDGALPWRAPEDLKWFRELTMGQTLIAGYRTAQTLPPLPGRELLVMKRGDTPLPYLVLAKTKNKDLWIIGGAQTYKLWAPYVDRFHISQIDYDGPADTYFPDIIPHERKTR